MDYNLQTIDVRTFMDAAFPSEILNTHETAVISHPANFMVEGESVDYFRKLAYSPKHFRGFERAWYVCISSAEMGEKVRTRMQDIRRCFLIVFDDIGTKASEPPVPPSYKLETSAGNYQWGYFIDPYDVTDTAGQKYVDSIMEAAANIGFNDPGCRNPTRLVRVPGSLHGTGFKARITYWHPERCWALDDLAGALGLAVRRRRLKNRIEPLTRVALSDIEDPILDWLREHGLVGGHNDAWVYVPCPWDASHTKTSGVSSTAYSPDGYGMMGRQFKCMHGHCAGRTLGEYLTELRRMGAPVVEVKPGVRLRDYSNALKVLADVGETKGAM